MENQEVKYLQSVEGDREGEEGRVTDSGAGRWRVEGGEWQARAGHTVPWGMGSVQSFHWLMGRSREHRALVVTLGFPAV